MTYTITSKIALKSEIEYWHLRLFLGSTKQKEFSSILLQLFRHSIEEIIHMIGFGFFFFIFVFVLYYNSNLEGMSPPLI